MTSTFGTSLRKLGSPQAPTRRMVAQSKVGGQWWHLLVRIRL
ncbi:hypothetical protein ACFOLD_01900 [Kocuria carniphila]